MFFDSPNVSSSPSSVWGFFCGLGLYRLLLDMSSADFADFRCCSSGNLICLGLLGLGCWLLVRYCSVCNGSESLYPPLEDLYALYSCLGSLDVSTRLYELLTPDVSPTGSISTFEPRPAYEFRKSCRLCRATDKEAAERMSGHMAAMMAAHLKANIVSVFVENPVRRNRLMTMTVRVGEQRKPYTTYLPICRTNRFERYRTCTDDACQIYYL